MSAANPSISILCVYNDDRMRRQCLDRSIQDFVAAPGEIQYVPIENVTGTFSSAGSALNHGVSQSTGDIVVFVHQDVFLHSLSALQEAARAMTAGGFGLLGAIGISRDGQLLGQVRDGVVLIGEPTEAPADVTNIDEVFFMAPRQQLLREPLTESADMAWHGYAVEYSLRLRRSGQRVGVTDVGLTHNTLRTNMARLNVAHRALGDGYPEMLPISTTCGVVTARRPQGESGKSRRFLSSHRWRYPWLVESLQVQRAGSAARTRAVVLADIRQDVDDIVRLAPGRRLQVINLLPDPSISSLYQDALELERRDGSVTLTARPYGQLAADLPQWLRSWTLITNLSRSDLELVTSGLPDAEGVLGFHTGLGFWLLWAPGLASLPRQWQAKRAIPIGAVATRSRRMHSVAHVESGAAIR